MLGSSCDQQRTPALRGAGVELAELGAEWALAEPGPGQYADTYIAELRDAVQACRASGVGVVLTLGLQYAPDWVADLPNGTYRNQHGGLGPTRVANVIFSSDARRAAAAYLGKLNAAIPLENFAAVRVGTSESGELGYPGRIFGTDASNNNFWAFDAAAQTGDGLADGMEATPLPGWIPGGSTWAGATVSTRQVQEWFDWYVDAPTRAIVWEIELVRSLGYRGDIHLPLAGRGALPTDLAAAVDAHLDGSADRDGSLERGLFYPRQLASLATAASARVPPGSVAADVTGVDDATAVQARLSHPAEDTCRAGDADRDLITDESVEHWSASRWTIANARRAGLRVVGENPGPPADPGNGGDPMSDSLRRQLEHAPRYARECGLDVLMWAFEDELFNPSSGITLDDVARRIRSLT